MRFIKYLNEKHDQDDFIEKIKNKCSYYIENFYKKGIIFYRGENESSNLEDYEYKLFSDREPQRYIYRIV